MQYLLGSAVWTFVCVCCSFNLWSFIGLTLFVCVLVKVWHAYHVLLRQQWTTPCKTPHGFSPLDFWVPTHLVVCPKSHRRRGSHGFGHAMWKTWTQTFTNKNTCGYSSRHCIVTNMWFCHGLTKSPPRGSRWSTQDLCKRNTTSVFHEEKIWWKLAKVSWLNFSQGQLGAFGLKLKHVFQAFHQKVRRNRQKSSLKATLQVSKVTWSSMGFWWFLPWMKVHLFYFTTSTLPQSLRKATMTWLGENIKRAREPGPYRWCFSGKSAMFFKHAYDATSFFGCGYQNVLNMCYFHPLGKWSDLTNTIQMGWKYQLVFCLG